MEQEKNDIAIAPDRLIELIEAALSMDHATVRRFGNEFAQLCHDQGDEVSAKRLRSFARRRGVAIRPSEAHHSLPVDGISRLPLVDEEPWPNKPIILNDDAKGIVERFLRDVNNANLLSEGGLLTRFGLMLSGPPGTGKTLLAGHIAAQLRRPFYIARLDSLISSRLGETAKNIRQIFDFAPAKGGVLFLDELDAIAKMRDDRQELGELKRVVNTVIQGLDSLGDHAIVIAATNHPQILDHAIWRRFPYRCDINLPNEETRAELWSHFLYSDDKAMRRRALLLSQLSADYSGADIENLALATRRLALLNGIKLPEPQLLWALSNSRPPGKPIAGIEKLKADQNHALVSHLGRLKGISKTELAQMLCITRQRVHRILQEDNHE